MDRKNFNTKEAAEYLKNQGTPFSRGTLEVWRHQKRGPSYRKIGNKVFYPRQSLDTFVEGQTVLTVDSV